MKYRLLVIEDEKHIADLVSHVGRDVGLDTRVADRLTNIGDLYNEFLPHMVVLDIMMPEMDGFEVLSFLHSRRSQSQVILLSGQSDYRQMASRLAQGLDLTIAATVAKPFRIKELRQTLTNTKYAVAMKNTTLTGAVA